jgi:DNA polymerase I-like protein with 3'-5' exonuclease and polymerase domains
LPSDHARPDHRTDPNIWTDPNILLEAPKDTLEQTRNILRRAMTDALPLPNGVPIQVDTATGENWFQAHP